RSLMADSTRSGLQPLLAPKTPIYCESWHHGQGLGRLIDSVASLPELSQPAWAARSAAVRIAISALWSLIYEEGPGKSDSQLTQAAKAARAYLQIGIDQQLLALRLCYAMPNWTPRDALTTFWPNVRLGTAPAQLLLRHCDFLRVHHIPEPSDIEITLGFFAGSPVAENFHGQVHTLWVEPLSASTVTEMPFETPNQAEKNPLLKPLPQAAGAPPSAAAAQASEIARGDSKAQRFILEAAAKIRELKTVIAEKDEQIRELRSGGIGTARPLPPPDVESLIEALQERYLDLGFRIQQLADQVEQMERDGAQLPEIEALRQKMNALAVKQKTWVKKIGGTIELLREVGPRGASAKKASGGE
ncbi:MAG TPA: hypothetical protein VM598_10460, partial [Bdellovibrionota bacterium]|nr:hypothetical protein [Bdellovibrionota bacterium]